MKQVITHPSLPAPTGAFSPVISARGTFVFLCGQVGRNPKTGLAADGIEAQTRQALDNLQVALRAAGADLKDVVRMLVFLADLTDGDGFNKTYASYFTEAAPVRTRVQAAGLAPGILVEMEAIAVLPD
jgi:2-iminobutanoate/2-iminopropanoate deaminase